MSLPQKKTIQPLYLAQANVFFFLNRCWSSARDYQVPISILYDENRAIYRIISMDLGSEANKRVLINSTLLPVFQFHKTSTTFGHWTDKSTGKVYGIGFQSQFELDAFEDSLKKAQAAIYTIVSKDKLLEHQLTDEQLKQSKDSVDNCICPSGVNYKNWTQLLHQVKKTHAKVPTILIPEAVQSSPTALSNQLLADFTTLRQENEKLRQVSHESCTNARKWQLQIATLQSENQLLQSKMDQTSEEYQELKKQECDFKSALIKWQECITKNAGKLQESTKDVEERIQQTAEEIRGLELKLRQQRKQKEDAVVTPEDLVRLEVYFKGLLEGTRKNFESVAAANKDGKALFQRVDYLFAKCINDMIGIHGVISRGGSSGSGDGK